MVSEKAVLEVLRRYRIASCYKGFHPLVSLVTENARTGASLASSLKEISGQYHIPFSILRQRVRIIARRMERTDPQGFHALIGSERYSLEALISGLVREAEQASKEENSPPA